MANAHERYDKCLLWNIETIKGFYQQSFVLTFKLINVRNIHRNIMPMALKSTTAFDWMIAKAQHNFSIPFICGDYCGVWTQCMFDFYYYYYFFWTFPHSSIRSLAPHVGLGNVAVYFYCCILRNIPCVADYSTVIADYSMELSFAGRDVKMWHVIECQVNSRRNSTHKYLCSSNYIIMTEGFTLSKHRRP